MIMLTLYHTISTFNDLGEKKPFENIVGKGENAGHQHFLLFPQFFAALAKGQQAIVKALCPLCTHLSVRLCLVSKFFP